MSEIRLNIDGHELKGFEGQTILEIARENGIEIPTLCHDDRVNMYGSCGICVVEQENSAKLLRSCSTYASDGMVIMTGTEKVKASRKIALELLLSDHTGDCRPPCVLNCPAQTDCQGYVGLIANGEYEQALKLIKDKIPLPGSIGKVCPHPCEDACRREMVEEPVSIAALKQFAADKGGTYNPEPGEGSGKSVAVIGGGPGGLSAAYFLRISGHEVTVYDAMPQMGGMLRYGIPEYRLPKLYLQAEIDSIEDMGVRFINNIKIGKDISLEYLRSSYDAVIIAVGAWTSTALRCPGEELDGVLGGIDFLRDAAFNKPVYTGRKIAVVGGGNTAMDVCRTLVRLGADAVYNIYRRTKNEMPAEKIEIIEAEEEGVIFKNLTNPIEILGENGKVSAIRLQIMQLGEPDASGRRAPVPVEGKEETLEVDTVIAAIGQKLNPSGLDGVELTKWQTVSADENTFLTSLDGVFAIGDATNNGADIAISAIGEAKKASEMVDKYLAGEKLCYQKPFLVKSEPAKEDFAEYEKEPRAKMPHRTPEDRRCDFAEINHGLSEEEAKREANRCLECGCLDYFECKLLDLANQYMTKPEKLSGKKHERKLPPDHAFISRNPDKCILCGLCMRICDEVVGAAALGLVGRGFDTIVKPAMGAELGETDCISCGLCVSVCPTGALTETFALSKQVPLRETFTETTCASCSVGCRLNLAHSGSLITRAMPLAENEKDAFLCVNGRFGINETAKKERLKTPLVRGESSMEEASFEHAMMLASKRFQGLISRFGKNCVAVAVSDRYTNEELKLIKEYANKCLATDKLFSFSRRESGLSEVLGRDASTATLDEMENTELIVLTAPDLMKSHAVSGMRIRRAVQNGAKLLIISNEESLLDNVSVMKLDAGENLNALKQIAKAVSDTGQRGEKAALSGFSLSEVSVSEAVQKAADMILKARKAVFVFDKNAVSKQGAELIANIALLSGHGEGQRNGVVQLLPGVNSQGLSDLGIESSEVYLQQISNGEIRGLFIFGEDVPYVDLSALEFLAVHELHLTDTARKADIVFPASGFAEICGSVTSADGKVQRLNRAIEPVSGWDNIKLITELERCYTAH